MSKEIERKFYLQDAPAFLTELDPIPIKQGYIAAEDPGNEVRVREKGGIYWLTVKSGMGMERTEVEIAISETDFRVLWGLTEGKRLEKDRYLYPVSSFQAEIDVYKGPLKGLFVAEVEFPSVEAANAFEVPDWMGIEITENLHFTNRTLTQLTDISKLAEYL